MTEPRSPAPSQDAHKRIAGYEILTKLGQGGMGAVYKARQVSLDRLVALKVLPKQLTDKTDFVSRFSREARLTGQLNHSHIIKVYDVGRSPTGIWYYAMEFVEGESLRAIQERQQRLPPQRVARILEEMADALDHAHKHGVIHRDIKPDNILINREGSVKLADLGLAKLAEDAALAKDASFKSLAGTVVGTPYYMAPEQVEGKPVDIRSDLYALGATAYHLLAGTPPFTADTAMGVLTKHVTEPLPSLRAQAPGVPPGLEAVIQRLMEKDPAARYQTPAELLAALVQVRQEVARATRPGARAARAVGRMRRTAAGVGLLLLVGVGLLVYAKSRQRKVDRLSDAPASVPAPPEDRKAVEKKAQEALEAVEAYGAGAPRDTEGYLARLRDLEAAYPGTRAATAARRYREEVEKGRETHEEQQAALNSLRLTVETYIAAKEMGKAREALDKAPRTESTVPVIQELEKLLPPWRCDFEHGEAESWRLEVPFTPHEGVRGDLTGELEARRKVTAFLGTAGAANGDVQPLEGQASLRLGARALGGEASQGCNGEAQGPFFSFRAGERLSLRCRLCVIGGTSDRPEVRHLLPELAYLCLRDEQGGIVRLQPDPKARPRRSLIRDLGFLYARGLDHNEALGSPLLPRTYEGAVMADPSKLAWGEKGPRRVQLCAGLSLRDAPGRSVVLILDDIKISNVEDAP